MSNRALREMKYTPADVITGIFANLPRGDSEKRFVRNDISDMMKFFYERRKDYKVLKGIAFDADGIGPWSSDLDNGIYVHFVSGVFEMANDYQDISAGRAVEIGFDKYVKKRFNDKELEEIAKLSKEFGPLFLRRQN